MFRWSKEVLSKLAPITARTQQWRAYSAKGQRVDMFYDVVSPYAWIGYELMQRVNQHWHADFRLRPVFFFGIMKEAKSVPAGMVPVKFKHVQDDLKRLAKYYDIPISTPSNPEETLIKKGGLLINPARFLAFLDLHHPQYLEGVSKQLWGRIWGTDEDITSNESLAIAAKTGGCPDDVIEDALKKLKSDEVKARLSENNKEALSLGTFGVPTFVTYNSEKPQIFWGSDRFQLIAEELGEKDPTPYFRS